MSAVVAAPGVTVVIPVFDGEKYLAAAITSILAQTAPPAEIIVVDDGSSDGTADIARSFVGASAATLVRYDQGPHEGGAQALNRGIALAQRELIAFLDADDLWLPDKLAAQLAVLAAQPDVDLVFGHMIQFASPELPEDKRARFDVPAGAMPGRSASALLARRSVFLRVGNLATDLRTGWFIDWSMRAADLGIKDVMLPEVVVHRRIHGDNLGLRDPNGRRDYLEVVRRNMLRRRQREAGS